MAMFLFIDINNADVPIYRYDNADVSIFRYDNTDVSILYIR